MSGRRKSRHQRVLETKPVKDGYSRWFFGDQYAYSALAKRSSHRLQDALSRAGNQLHSIGIGYKRVDGQETDTPCVRFYIIQKLPKQLVPLAARLPSSIDGLDTDVVEAPPAHFAASTLACSINRRRRQRPMQPGISVASGPLTVGTLGAFCNSTRPGEAGQTFLLTNNHVIADFNAAPVGEPIYQPARRDSAQEAELVGHLSRFHPLVMGAVGANVVDVAIARVDPQVGTEHAICGVGLVAGVGQATMGLKVQKHGRSTGLTNGLIDDLSMDVVMPISGDSAEQVAHFVDQIRVVPAPGTFLFAQGGDSGSLLVGQSSRRAVGLLFATPDDGSYACANPISEVLKALEIRFI